MNRVFALVLALAFMISVVPVGDVYAAGGYNDNVVDQAGDWFATLGKEGVDKDKVLAERKAKRMAKYAETQARKAKKEVEKAGKDMKKKMGL
jgi:hypothetical protein